MLLSEESPLFRPILLSFLMFLIGWGMPSYRFMIWRLVYPPWSYQCPLRLRSLMWSCSYWHPLLLHFLCYYDPRACARTISLFQYCSCYGRIMFLHWLNLVGCSTILQGYPECFEGCSWCMLAPCFPICNGKVWSLPCSPLWVDQDCFTLMP